MTTKLTSKEAFAVASRWGCLVRGGEPGAVFYTFPLDNARVVSEEHRAQLIAYTKSCILYARQNKNPKPPNTRADADELGRLLDYFETAPVG